MNIGDLFWGFRGEDAGLQLDAKKAGAAAASALGLAYAPALKKIQGGITAIGGVAGLAFGAASSGAVALDSATRQLQSDTGMTADEAKRAGHALAEMSKGNLQNFDEIGAAMAKVHNDLGLTGDAADAMTAKFLKFGTATGQNAADAVVAFDDVLDAWNLRAEDSADLMDKLIASHQKFGGSVPESTAALSAMAPAMQAANMSVDDGIALLNLFNASGIDAAKAPAALAKAVKLLKPGQDLNDLIAQIGAIEDPTVRGQKAMVIFGAKSGIGLAQAIKPGMTSLADFGLTVEETAGKTDDAAKVIEDSFGNRAKLALKGFQTTLAEVGTSFGDLLIVAGALGPKLTGLLTSAVGAAFGALATSPLASKAIAFAGGKAATLYLSALIAGDTISAAVSGAWTKVADSSAVQGAAKLAGTKGAMALRLGLAAGLVGVEAMVGSAITNAAAEGTSKTIAQALTDQNLEGLRNARENLRRAIDAGKIGGVIDLGDALGLTTGSKANLAEVEAAIAQLEGKLERGGRDIGQGWTTAVATGMSSKLPTVMGAVMDFANGVSKAAGETGRKALVAEVVKAIGLTVKGVKAAARTTGAEGMAALAAGITEARQKPLDAFNTLKDMLKNAMTPMAEIHRLAGERSSKALARGLQSGDPAVRAQALAVVKSTAERLAEIALGGGKAGKAAMRELEKGIHSKIPAVREASRDAKDAVIEKLDATKGPAADAGTAAGKAFAAALRRAVATGDFHINASVGFTLPNNAAGGEVIGPTWVGEKGPEIWIPETAGRILSHADSMAAVSGTGNRAVAQSSGNFTLQIQGVQILTPGAADQLARLIEPMVTRRQQGRQILAGR